jgi:hypothetical protein
MKVKTAELRRIINLLKPGLAKKEYLEQSSHFVFTGVDVCTFNGSISVIHPFETEGPSFSVKAEDFHKLIGGIVDEELDLKIDNGRFTLSSNTTKAGMSTVVDDAGKVEPLIDKVKADIPAVWNKLPKDFTDGIRFVVFSAAKNLSQGAYANIQVNGKRVESADGRMRASIYAMDGEMQSFLISASDALELTAFPVTEYVVTPNWMHFKTDDDVIFSCLQRILGPEEKFPNLDSHFNAIVDPLPLKLPVELRQAVRDVVFLAKGETDNDKECEVVFKKGVIEVSARKDNGWVEKFSVFPEYNGPDVSILINPIAFSQILEKATDMIISRGNNRVFFKNDKFRHLLAMLIAAK